MRRSTTQVGRPFVETSRAHSTASAMVSKSRCHSPSKATPNLASPSARRTSAGRPSPALVAWGERSSAAAAMAVTATPNRIRAINGSTGPIIGVLGSRRRVVSGGLLRQAGGFEGIGAVTEELGAEEPPLPHGENAPASELNL